MSLEKRTKIIYQLNFFFTFSSFYKLNISKKNDFVINIICHRIYIYKNKI